MSTTTKQKKALDTKVDGLTGGVSPLNRFFFWYSLLLTLLQRWKHIVIFVKNEIVVSFDRDTIWQAIPYRVYLVVSVKNTI